MLILIVLVGTLSFVISQILPEENFKYSFTKAVCNEENYCEDYEIVCEENKLLEFNPTGFAVQFSEEWKDPRNKDAIEKRC